MKTEAQRQGKRNRQRGAELQRQAVKIAKEFDLESYNRDRGGAQHEQGDIEIEEHGVVFRMDRNIPYISIPYDTFCLLLKMSKAL